MKVNRTASKKQSKAAAGKSKRLLKSSRKTGGNNPPRQPASMRAGRAFTFSEDRLRAIFEQSPLSIQVLSANGDSLWANRAWEELWGLRREQLQGYNVLKDPQVKARGLLPYFERALNGETVSIPPVYHDPMEIGQKDRARWTKAALYPVKDASGQVREVVLTHEDITERKQAEEALRNREEQLSFIYDTVADVIFHLDVEKDGRYRFVSVNKAFLATTGLKFEQVVGKRVDEVVPEPSLSMVLGKYQEAIRGKRIVRWEETSEYPVGRLTGEVSIAPVFDDAGNCTHLVGGVHDVTGRKQAEAHVRQYADIVRNMQIGLYVFHLEDREDDRSLRLVSANPAALQFSGVMAEEVVGKTLDEGFPDLREMGIPQKYAEVIRAQKAVEIEVIYYDNAQQLDTVYAVKAFPLPNDHVGVAFESVTERKLVEEALRQNQMILAQAGKMAHLGAWEIEFKGYENVNDNPLRWSDEVYRIFGYEPGTVQVTNDFFFECVHPQDRQKIAEAFRRALAEKRSYEIEHRVIRPDGVERIVLEHGDTVYGEDGQPLRLFGAVQDITERKQAEQSRRESEERLRSLFENSPLAIWEEDFSQVKAYLEDIKRKGITDLNAYLTGHREVISECLRLVKVLDVNQAALKLYEANSKSYLLGNLDKTFPQESLSRFKYELLVIANGGLEFQSESAVNSLLGNRRIVSLNWAVAPGSEQTYAKVLVSLIDITERKQTEEKLRDSEKRFRALIENSSEEVSLLAADGTLLYESPSAHPTLGYATGEFLGQRLFQLVHPDDIERVQRLFFNLTQKPGSSLRDEFRLRHKSGEWRWAEAVGTNLLAESAVQAVVVNYHDITERKQAEQAVQESEQRYRAVFESTPVAIWEEDYSQVKQYVDALKEKGIFDLQAYFKSNPAALRECMDMIRVLDVNETALRMYEAESKEELIRSAMEEPGKGELEYNSRDFAAIAEGFTRYEWEGEDETLKGKPIVIHLAWSVVPGHEADYSKVIVTTLDITERRQAEEELNRSYSLLNATLESTADGILVVGLDGKISGYNRKFLELWRIPEELASKRDDQTLLDYVLNQLKDPSAFLVKVEKLYQFPDTASFDELEFLDGRVFERYSQPQKRDDSVLGRVWSFRDITERKKAENELQTSEERFRLLAGNIQEVFWITDPISKKDLYLSPAYAEVWGRRLEEQLQNQNVFIESVLPEDRQMVLETIEKQMRGDNTEMEYRIRRPDGSIRWIWDRAFPILDESQKVKLITGIAADVTERKQAEAETLRHLDELQALYENGLAVGRLLTPREIGERVIQTFTHYLSWHHATIRLRKGESDDLELIAFGMPHLEEDEKTGVEQNFNARINKVGQGMSGWVVQTGIPVCTGNVRVYPQYVDTYEGIQSGMYMPMKVGEQVIGSISVESELADAFTLQDERLLATLATQAAVAFENARLYQAIRQELGERRRAEEMLEQERNSLARRVEERTAELIAANSNLARALRVKDEFLANMSHELRTPLNAILGLSESLGEQVAGSLNEKQRRYVQTITESGHHLLALINDILDLAKIEAGQVTLDIAKVDVHSLCQSSLRMVKQIAQKKNQEVSLEIDEDFGLIWADERRLKQMIVNLLSNAVKFTPEGGRLGLEVHGDKDDNRVLITVWDRGIGIAANDIAKLFQPFVQLSTGLARESTGTGLGLTLVAQMARLHGGGVSVSSIPGEGSRFTLVLPWEPALAADTMERMKVTGKFRAVRKINEQERRTILLIEDTPEVVMMVKDYLELAGFHVATAEDGLDGIVQAKRIRPDLILMDMQMPRMDGIEATKKLRNDPDFKRTPIIALTALAMQGDRERCLAAGMDEYITKPVNLKGLVRIIEACLAQPEGSEA